jgi:hypothetical protein
MSLKESGPGGSPGPVEPKKIRPGFLLDLEEQRRQRRLEALQRRFDATIQHIEQVERVNEECYRRQMEVTQAAKTGSALPPPAPPAFPPPTPLTSQPPAGNVFRKPWIRNILRAPAAASPRAEAKPSAKPKKAKRKR